MSSRDSAPARQHEMAVVSIETHAGKLKVEAHTLTSKETVSAQFSIAAAAFGLISDGYQNNLMTMSNARSIQINEYS
jgi:hypothetical protein